MRIVIDSEDKTGEICSWVLPENVARVIAELPADETRELILRQLTTLLKAQLDVLTAAMLCEDIFDTLKLVAVSMDQLTETVGMMI